MMIIKSLNLSLRFLLELFALAAIGYWGFITGKGIIMKSVLGIGLPLVLAVVWGIFGSPKALIKLPTSLHLLIEVVIFVLPTVALYTVGKVNLAWGYGLVAVINRTLMFLWKQ